VARRHALREEAVADALNLAAYQVVSRDYQETLKTPSADPAGNPRDERRAILKETFVKLQFRAL